MVCFGSQFGRTNTLQFFKDFKLYSDLRNFYHLWKTHLCMFFPNCTRNHTITYNMPTCSTLSEKLPCCWPLIDTVNDFHFIFWLLNFILATNCSVLTCGKNQVCENIDGIFQCVCHGDYTGNDCSELRKYFLMWKWQRKAGVLNWLQHSIFGNELLQILDPILLIPWYHDDFN
jgi:hypothetical protein